MGFVVKEHISAAPTGKYYEKIVAILSTALEISRKTGALSSRASFSKTRESLSLPISQRKIGLPAFRAVSIRGLSFRCQIVPPTKECKRTASTPGSAHTARMVCSYALSRPTCSMAGHRSTGLFAGIHSGKTDSRDSWVFGERSARARPWRCKKSVETMPAPPLKVTMAIFRDVACLSPDTGKVCGKNPSSV